MTLDELMIECKKYKDKGYGEKTIVIDGDPEFNVDSIQQASMPNVEPEYLLIMIGEDIK